MDGLGNFFSRLFLFRGALGCPSATALLKIKDHRGAAIFAINLSVFAKLSSGRLVRRTPMASRMCSEDEHSLFRIVSDEIVSAKFEDFVYCF